MEPGMGSLVPEPVLLTTALYGFVLLEAHTTMLWQFKIGTSFILGNANMQYFQAKIVK